MEMLLDMVIQNVQEALKKFQDDKKEYKKTQKQISEFIGALNKYQSETENTIIREINELRTKIDNIEEEVTHDIEKLQKKNETEIQNTMEGHSSRLEQAEDTISELEDEMEIKQFRQFKTCEKYAKIHQLHQKIKPENHGY
jgi:chromosome segregation ATPase